MSLLLTTKAWTREYTKERSAAIRSRLSSSLSSISLCEVLWYAAGHDQVAKADAGTGSGRARYLGEQPAGLFGAHELADIGEAEASIEAFGCCPSQLLRGSR